MTGHTAEEWTFNELPGDDFRGMGYVNDGSEDIAHVGVMGYSTQQNLKLAHLIAATPALLAAARAQEDAEEANANCDECEGEGVPEACPKCFPLFDDARLKRRAAIAAATPDGEQ